MAVEIRIPSIRCNEETDGVGDDEISLIVAALPVDTDSEVWTYGDRWPECQQRFLPDVSTGDSHTFGQQEFGPDGPIVFTREIRANQAIEVWLLISEVDGGGDTTYSRATRGLDAFYSELAGRARPGAPVGSVGPTVSNRTWREPATGSWLQTIGFDVFTINMAQPVAGAIDPEYPTPDFRQITAQSGADAVYKNSMDGGSWLSETRSYRNEALDARYTLDIEYRLVD